MYMEGHNSDQKVKGLNRAMNKMNCERRTRIKKSKGRSLMIGHNLKRLQRRLIWQSWKKEISHRFQRKKERQELKMSRGRLHHKSTCPLWNCRRPRGFRAVNLPGMDSLVPRRLKRCTSRLSVLSDLSRRSRTPIMTLRSSPFRNDQGFSVMYD